MANTQNGNEAHSRRSLERVVRPPFKELFQYAARALDRIYNESDEARGAVIKHYGLYHYPYNDKFRRFLRRSNAEVSDRPTK